jgi:hypothetical protein
MARDIFQGVGRNGRGRAFEWQSLHNSRALELLAEILECGAYVGLGTTTDGGAAGITVLVGDSRAKEYWTDLDSDEVAEWLSALLDRIKDPPSTPTRARGRGGPNREEKAPPAS